MANFSLNALAGDLADAMIREADRLRIGVAQGRGREVIVDCGAGYRGGVDAGLRLAAVAMAGLGTLSLAPSQATPRWPWHVVVRTSQPVTACLASQYAGWALKHEDAGGRFVALGSGPARALARREELFGELAHQESADRAVLILESDAAPPPPLLERIAADCHIAPSRLTVFFAPLRSLAGTVQVVARCAEVALHKAHLLKFPLADILEVVGSAPLCPPHPDLVAAMGRTNDAIIYGGGVHLFVAGAAADAACLAAELPSSTSPNHGAPFAEIFKRADGDFYAIDPALFSPAFVAVTAVDSGETFRAGAISNELLDASFV